MKSIFSGYSTSALQSKADEVSGAVGVDAQQVSAVLDIPGALGRARVAVSAAQDVRRVSIETRHRAAALRRAAQRLMGGDLAVDGRYSWRLFGPTIDPQGGAEKCPPSRRGPVTALPDVRMR